MTGTRFRDAGQADVLAFLAAPDSYPDAVDRVEPIETHMSWVFLTGRRVYKMKKAIRLGFVDFTSLESRRVSCERELKLNQQLAPGIYLEVVPVCRRDDGALSLGRSGEPVEWVLVMRRLPAAQQLDKAIAAGRVGKADVDRICDALVSFYLGAATVTCSAVRLIESWSGLVGLLETSLTDPLFALPADRVGESLGALWTFLDRHAGLLVSRLEAGRIVDGHGDLRPEHVHLGPPIRLIDRLELDDRLRWVDPFDEVGSLGLECEMLGAPWIGTALSDCLSAGLNDRPPPELLRFYRCYRALLRARLSIEHLRDPAPRTPERWPRQARAYLELARRTWADQS